MAGLVPAIHVLISRAKQDVDARDKRGHDVAQLGARQTESNMIKLAAEEMTVSSEPGIDIYVRNKRPAEMTGFTPERTLLFVHGSTYPAHTTFDLPLGGQSWMESIAARGYDVYCLDIRGYGRSTRPAAMDDKPEANPPVVRTADAVKDVEAVLGFILERRGLSRINLMGWSWGSTIMATATTRNPDKVARLTLYAPPWIRTTPSLLNAGPGPLGAYRTVTQEQARTRWLAGVPDHKKATQIPPGWFEQWAATTWATDPVGAQRSPPAIRAPNGTVADTAEYWLAGKPYYDPAKVTAPTLIVIGEWDNDTPPYMAQALFPLLLHSPGRRMVMLPEATHTMMLEKNRPMLFRTVQAFLDEGCE
jgi:pimeloyl-ACP methyl ester carboxylesterase